MNLLMVPKYRENLVKLACFEDVPEDEHADLLANIENPEFASAVFVPFERVFDYDANIEDKDKWTDAMKALLDARVMLKNTPDGVELSYALVRNFMDVNFSAQRLAFVRSYTMTVCTITGSVKFNSIQLKSLVHEVSEKGWNVERLRMGLMFLACGVEMPNNFKQSLISTVTDVHSELYVPWVSMDDDDDKIRNRNEWTAVSAQWMLGHKFIFVEGGHIYFNVTLVYWWMEKNFSEHRFEFLVQYCAFVSGSQGASMGDYAGMQNYANDLSKSVGNPMEAVASMLRAILGGLNLDTASPARREELKGFVHSGITEGMKAAGVPNEIADVVFETYFGKIDDVIDGTMSVDEFMTVFE